MPGELSIHADGIAFQADKPGKGSLSWRFEDVQHLDRLGPAELAIQSYDDALLRLGRDRWYRFALTAGTMTDELHGRIVDRIGKASTDRAAPVPPDAELAIPAKRVRLLRGSEGMLYFMPDRIVYTSPVPRASRSWRLGPDVESVWSDDPFRLEVHVRGSSESFLRRIAVYRFALKRPLDPAFYDRLRLKLHEARDGR